MRTPLVDTHCHLYLDASGPDAPLAAWERARSSGVMQAVIPAIDVASSRAVVALADPGRGLFAAVGIHPNDTSAVGEQDHAAIAELSTAPGVVAIGESGLDCYRDRAELPRQIGSLRRHAELALARDLPLILHVRQAFAPTAEALAPFAARGLRAVMHCFDGGPADLEPWLSWGFFISFSGIVTYPTRVDLRAAARATPGDRVVVETDAPFLAPVPKRGRPNEPAFLLHTAEALAAARGEPLDEFAVRSTANARRLFRLPEAAG
jgi:TatD DNase family protein